MAHSNLKEIEEVFVIQTEAIGFSGALAKEKRKGLTIVHTGNGKESKKIEHYSRAEK